MNTRIFAFCLLLAATIGRAAPAPVSPSFEEMYQLLRSNLDGVSQAELNRAAVKGLLEQFPGQVALVKEESKAAESPPPGAALGKVAVYDDSYAYFRIGKVEGQLAEKLRTALQQLTQTNKSKIKGIILDLRFASGHDYAAAAAVADCFLNSDQPLLDWGARSAHATKKSDPISLPVAILVNSKTTGAAEALAAAMRVADVGLILGGATAGQANIFKEFPLANGEKLRIATAQIKLGDGAVLLHGLQPDISVDSSLADDRAYLEDPYKILHPPAPPPNGTATDTVASTRNQPSHRENEAELVRERRDGEMSDDGEIDEDNVPLSAPPPPAMTDAALSRAVDLLKGIAVLQESRPG